MIPALLILFFPNIQVAPQTTTDYCIPNSTFYNETADGAVLQSQLAASTSLNYLCLLDYPSNDHCKEWRVAPLIILTDESRAEENTLAIQQFLNTVTEYCGNASYMMPFLPSYMNQQCNIFPFGNNNPDSWKRISVENTLVPDGVDAVQLFEDLLLSLFVCTQQPLEEATAGAVFIFSDFLCEPLCERASFGDLLNNLIVNTSTTKYVTSAYFLGNYSKYEEACITIIFIVCQFYKRQICNLQFYSDLTTFVEMGEQEHTCALAEETSGTNDTALILEIVIPSVVGCLLLLVVSILAIRSRSRRKWFKFWWEHSKGGGTGQTTSHRAASMNEYYDADTRRRDEWEVSPENLEIRDSDFLGHGAFAEVYKATLTDSLPLLKINPSIAALIEGTASAGHVVAVKRLPNHADDQARSDFLKELDFMKTLGYHTHIISLLGCVSNPVNPMIIVEYCANGDLLQFLRKNKGNFVPDGYVQQPVAGQEQLRLKDLLSFAWQVADGMVYLSSNKSIHRDLASRNVFLTQKLVAKIGDFGLCRTVDTALYTTRGGRLPLKWMAIESLKFYEYTTKSDVWSYGVVIFEIFSFGEAPYQLVQPMDMVLHLEAGNRLPKPEHCPMEIYDIMAKCWLKNPEDRPDFTEIRSEIGAFLMEKDSSYGYLRLDPRYSSKEQHLEGDEVAV